MPVLGCGGSNPSSAPPPAPAPPPEQSDASVIMARDAERNRIRKSASNTLMTGAKGVTSTPNVATKTLLGN